MTAGTRVCLLGLREQQQKNCVTERVPTEDVEEKENVTPSMAFSQSLFEQLEQKMNILPNYDLNIVLGEADANRKVPIIVRKEGRKVYIRTQWGKAM